MRKYLFAFWVVLLLGAWAYHEGPGQDRMALDDIDALLCEAHDAVGREQWGDVVTKYEEALQALPDEQRAAAYRVRLELAKARMHASQLPKARADLAELVHDLQEDERAAPELRSEARAALAGSQYYMTWLMRLEGEPREIWEPEIEGARQGYRWLAEEAQERADQSAAQRFTSDVESAVRLARMELTDLQGLPLPSQ